MYNNEDRNVKMKRMVFDLPFNQDIVGLDYFHCN